MPTASIIVCVQGAIDWLTRLVAYLGKYDSDDFEVLVVDDANDDANQQAIANLADQYRFRVLRLDTRHWYVRAANIGVAAATAEVVILLNSDALLSRTNAAQLVRAVRQHPTSLVGPVSNAAGYQSLPWVWAGPDKFAVCPLPYGVSPDMVEGAWRSRTTDDLIEVGLLNGFCLAFRKSLFTELGGFDESQFPFGYGEEYDLAIRLKAAGGRVVVSSSHYIFHAKTRSFADRTRTHLVAQARVALARRHGADVVARLRAETMNHPALAALRRDMLTLYREFEAVPPGGGPAAGP